MQTTVDTLGKEVLMAINRNEVVLKEKAFSAYAFNACLMGVDFVYINVSISALAALKTDNVHAKRYHWKNVVAGISEGIKYIYTFKECEKKTLIGYLKTILNDSDMMTPVISDFFSSLQAFLEKFRTDWKGKDMRDIALHYDKSAEKLIKETFFIAAYFLSISDINRYGITTRGTFREYFKTAMSGRPIGNAGKRRFGNVFGT